MSNKDTVNAIITNLEAIITTILKWQLEDLTENPEMDKKPLAQIIYNGEIFGENFNERKKYNEVELLIKVNTQNDDPDKTRDLQVDIVHDLNDNVNVETLSVGSLEGTNLITWVRHEDPVVDYDPPVSTIDNVIIVRYSEI